MAYNHNDPINLSKDNHFDRAYEAYHQIAQQTQVAISCKNLSADEINRYLQQGYTYYAGIHKNSESVLIFNLPGKNNNNG